MDKVIKERIGAIKNRCIPSGYCRTKDIGVAPEDWTLGKVSDVVNPIKRAVPKPDKPYWRLGIKSWAKGTFHAYVDDPETVDMDELYEVHENDLVVNITFAWEHAIAIANKDDQGLLVSHRFPTYEFKNGQVPNFYKAVITQKFIKDMLDHISPGGAGRNRVLNQKDFLNLPCYVPPLAEQEKISEILDHYDKLIKLCEAKVDEYKDLKKACLRKMFPQNGSSVPELRFPGFTDAWEQRKLGDIGTLKNGMNFSKDAMGHGFPFINLQNIFGKTAIDIQNLGKAKATLAQLKDYSLIKGDVLFVRSSVKLEGVGEAALVPETLENTTYSGFIIRFRDEFGLDDSFKRFVFSTEGVRKQIMSQATDSANKNISQTVLANMEIKIPGIEEQRTIGAFFRSLDQLITLHQCEVEEYTKHKKAISQLLLTGIVRV